MRALVLSDTHFEFHKDGGTSFVDYLWDENKHNPPDTVVLAGDISDFDSLRASVKLFAEKFEDSDIVLTNGNHEYYGTTPENVLKKSSLIEEDILGVHWLEPFPFPKDCVYSPGDGKPNFVGATLWFPECKTSTCKRYMNDFSAIFDFEPWVYEQNKKSVDAIAKYLHKGDILVTHHMPSEKSIHPWYADSPTNDFFVCDIEWILTSRDPALAVHGHTHLSCDYMIGNTRVVCNPFGYVRVDENKEFNPKLVIEV